MLGTLLGGLVRLGWATSAVVGLAVVLALVVGVSSAALAGNLDPLKVGSLKNVATKTTQLVGKVASGSAFAVKNPAGGSALDLRVNAGRAPLTVNAEAGTATNLSADELDGKDWQPEAWHNVGFPGEPAFGRGGADNDCIWGNFGDGQHNLAGFYKDQSGTVHLKGLVKVADGTGGQCDALDDDPQVPDANLTIFRLPDGYLPARRNVHVAISGEQLGRVDVDPDGTVSAGVVTPNTVANAKSWLSLDGITFRAEN
ncbi:MAG: hypothetical protein AVDCRST_MAG22-893 [uncultured Rubrobacteraceae bacterium]|uniref:Uncharacterized protein n=1 Tax=uncultured Rubrobacteraceae bacterium TaxID=349277 RepID=A0A6J4NRH3_9ACTN|nr:MAG: hypothetical protein AVDCRST_MAG22-893 [uncultured Rubrobacteraceae bacterium]